MLPYATILTFGSIIGFTQSLPGDNTNGIDRWCGKAYRPGDPVVEPGGRIEPPTLSKIPLLDLKIQPRISPYLASDNDGAFVIDTSLSYTHGQPFSSFRPLSPNQLEARQNDDQYLLREDTLQITISRTDTSEQIAASTVPVNASATEIKFSLNDFVPRIDAYPIHLAAKSITTSFGASTQLLRLPTPEHGSLTKIDTLYGALLIQDGATWTPFFPYSFYLGSGWIGDDFSQVAKYASYGYNVLHVIPPVDLDWFDRVVTEAEKVGLWIMYDMRHDYQDEGKVREQVERYRKRKNMLLWYTADEPDGHQDVLDATQKSYDLIKSLDPYHPVSLCLNCENYHFEEYSAGADILLADVYPIGTNTSFSSRYHTPCNSTYGCCGCDNCLGTDDLLNLPARLDTWSKYQQQLGPAVGGWESGRQKALWATPQAFGASEFWDRIPTADEEVAMTVLGVNHGAKGVVMWTWPTTEELADVTSRLGRVLGRAGKWVLGARLERLEVKALDVTVWVDEKEGTGLVSLVNPRREALKGVVRVDMLEGWRAVEVEEVLWGDGGWRVGDEGEVEREGVKGLGVEIVVVRVEKVGGGVVRLPVGETS